MSSRTQGYDSSESRRSPRDRSPGRYNDSRGSDQYRGSSIRGGERRRSIDEARGTNHGAFGSNRETFRESIGRDSSRDFPPRDAPRGPKALIDAPSGPRASSYGGDFRGDFGFRGDFRGGRGSRGRGRGWRDDSRDRGRDAERDYRDRRDDRGPPAFRDDRSRDRDRWDRDPFRGRRPSSPPGRGRSPNYATRDPRDAPPNLDLDRARRGSRDGPISASSPSSDSLQPFGRGYSRARGGSGRGRGRGYYDEYNRPPGRSRSPEPNWTRRTQPSATPPPQVPAFGSTASSLSVNSVPPSIIAPPSTSTSGPVVGVSVPTAPRSQRLGRERGAVGSSMQWINVDRKEESKPHPSGYSPVKDLSPLGAPSPDSESRPSGTLDKRTDSPSDEKVREDAAQSAVKEPDTKPGADSDSPIQDRKRKPIIGRRVPAIPAPTVHESTDEGSDSDSADDDYFFEDEITKTQEQVAEIEKKPKLEPRPESDAIYVRPFIDSAIDETIAATKSDEMEACPVPAQPWPIPAQERNAPLSESRTTEATLAPRPRGKGKSRSVTPLPEADSTAPPSVNGQDDQDESAEASNLDGESQGASIIVPPISSSSTGKQGAADRVIEPKSPVPSMPNGRIGRVASLMDQFEESDGDQTEAEKLETLQAVRKMMETPPLSSLPKFNCKRWDQDLDFLKSLDPNPIVENLTRKRLHDNRTRRLREQEEERQAWKLRYWDYRAWTDLSDDPAAVRSREKFSKSRAKAAADAAAPPPSLTSAPGTKPEGQRRTGIRFATERDFERVLRESEQEARETKEREERAARAKTASAKEAIIPEMWWDEEERLENMFIDRSHIVCFERSFARLEFGAPIDNFTEEECEIFEKLYLEFPKQWGKIAEALPRRDYKACIQHYYLVKHSSNIKEKLKKQPKKKKGRVAKGPKPKSNALMADLGNRDDGEDGQDAENGGERRRPRRAAAPTWSFEDTKGDSDVATPAPTPGRKTAATPKGENGNETAPTKKKAKVTREKGSKQSKNSQLLAAAPVAANHQGESPAPPSMSTPDWKNRRESGGSSRFPPQYDGTSQLQPNFAPPYIPVDRPSTSMASNFDFISQPLAGQDRLGSAPPVGFDSQQNQRNIQQTSSYWSVPEQTDFPALLKHFGTDWHGIAKFMTSKTHIMVYTTVFQQWLAVPSDSNKSRRVANIQTQVKNYYQRQVDSGKMIIWEEIAKDADEKRARGEPTGPLPVASLIPKRRYDGPPGSIPRSGSAMDGIDDLATQGQNIPLQQGSPQQPILSSRFPALAQAGPVPQTLSQPATPTSIMSKHSTQLPPQQAPQQIQQQNRTSRGPALGYFNNTDSQRTIMQASAAHQSQHTPPATDPAVSQRSVMAAQQAALEQQQALRLQQQQQQQALQGERQSQMKQENETPNLHQYEPFSTSSMHPNTVAHTRTELPQGAPPSDLRRTAPPQQYQPRTHPAVRSLLSDNTGGNREMKSTPPAVPRAPLSAPPTSQETYSAPPPQSQLPQASAARPQEPVRKSNIMSLLNDEPSDPRPPPKLVSDVSSSSLQTSQTPPPQHTLQASRFSTQPSQPHSQPPQQIPQQMSSQLSLQQQQQQLQQSHHPYAQASSHSMHQHSSSIGPPRSFTPTGFEPRGYGAASQMQQQQQMYSQPLRQPMAPQAPQIRREPSLGEMHGVTSGYSRTSGPSQPSMRLKESPYSATPPPLPPQASRQQVGSPLDLATPSEREYYARQPQYMMQQQSSAAGSPQLGPYHPQSQQQQSNHRQIAFGGQGLSHTASPPTQYATQHPMHRSRQNSFDGRYPIASSASTPSQQGYSQATHQAPPLGIQYHQQQQQPPPLERFDTREMELREREIRRMQEEAAYRRRLDDSRR